MKEQIEKIRQSALEEIKNANDEKVLNDARVKYLGKKGELTLILRGMGGIAPEERPVIGSLVNEVRDELENLIEEREKKFKTAEIKRKLEHEKIDVTMPGKKVNLGSVHPITQIIKDMEEIFIGMGYEIADGPEVELATYNFDKLNTPQDHPARDIQDTFYVTDDIVLRSQTSPVQARVMETQKPPIKIICPGVVYRSDSVDATHSPVFHQIEGLVVDKNISMGDLKGILEMFAKKCLGEKTQIRFRPHHFPFTEPSAEADVSCFVCGGKGCKVLNGRKVNLRAIVDANIIISANENVDFIKQVNNVGDVQVLNKKFNVNSLVGSGETKTYAKDTIKLNETDNLAEIMKCNFRILNKDVKISYNKVLVKSDLEAKILYLTDDNRINSVDTIIPVMGFIDVQDITEENICDVKYEICNVVIEPKSVEEHAIYVEVEIKIHGEAYQNKELNIIQDLYSPNAELSFTQKQIQAMQTKKTMQDTCSIRDKQIIPEMHGGKIYDVDIMPFIIKQSVSNNKILYEGEVKLNFVYSVNNFSGIDTREMVLPFNFSMQSDEIDTNTNIDTGIEVGLQNFVVTSDESIDIKIDLIFKVSMSNNSRINVIDGVEIDENKNIYKYSMVIYFVKPGDSLWKIAKKFGSTVSAIAEVNNIEQVDNISVGQQLFIPRYNG